MALYYFHLRDPRTLIEDEEGCEMADLAAVTTAALCAARDIIGHDAFDGVVRLGGAIEVEDEHRTRVHTLAFADAVTIER